MPVTRKSRHFQPVHVDPTMPRQRLTAAANMCLSSDCYLRKKTCAMESREAAQANRSPMSISGSDGCAHKLAFLTTHGSRTHHCQGSSIRPRSTTVYTGTVSGS